MNWSHIEALSVFALIVSTVFALINKVGIREQLKYVALVFLSFVGFAFVISWVMYPFPS